MQFLINSVIVHSCNVRHLLQECKRRVMCSLNLQILNVTTFTRMLRIAGVLSSGVQRRKGKERRPQPSKGGGGLIRKGNTIAFLKFIFNSKNVFYDASVFIYSQYQCWPLYLSLWSVQLRSWVRASLSLRMPLVLISHGIRKAQRFEHHISPWELQPIKRLRQKGIGYCQLGS